MQTGNRRVHILPTGDRGWAVRETVDGPPLRRTTTRRGAFGFAVALIERQGGDIVMHSADGSIEETHPIASTGPRPWWYIRPSWMLWSLGALFLLQGISQQIFATRTGWLVFGWFQGAVGILYLTVTTLSYRLDRRLRLTQANSIPSDDG